MLCSEAKKRVVSACLALVWAAGLNGLSRGDQQSDPFYLKLLNKAQKSFLAAKYDEAAQELEIAAFGLSQDPTSQAKAFIYLGISYYYLKDMRKSASFLRQAVDLLGEKGAASLDIPRSILPDLRKLLAFFDVQLALPAEDTASLPSQKQENKSEAPRVPPEKTQTISDPAGKKAAGGKEEQPAGSPATTLDKIKEGDIVARELVDTLPVATERIAPIYPSSTGGRWVEGTVTVNALISENGDVVKTEVIKGINEVAGFNQAALRAVRRWKFEPATVKGTKVKVWIPISVEFKRRS